MEWSLWGGLLLAAVGLCVAYVLIGTAYAEERRKVRAEPLPSGLGGKTLALGAVAESPFVIALVCTILVWLSGDAASGHGRLLIVGVAAMVAAVVQGLLARRGIPEIAVRPETYSRHLILVILPQALAVGGFFWFVLGWVK